MADDVPPPGKRVRVLHKVIAYVVVWALALFTTNPSLSFWALAYLFPLGLAAFVNLRWGNDGGWGVLILCFAIYVAQAIFYFRSKTIRSTALWLGVLIALLICNVAGCRAQLPR